MRNFHFQRHEDVHGNSGTGRVAEGTVFSNGKVALCWLTSTTSVAVYESIEDVEKLHGHEGRTEIIYEDNKGNHMLKRTIDQILTEGEFGRGSRMFDMNGMVLPDDEAGNPENFKLDPKVARVQPHANKETVKANAQGLSGREKHISRTDTGDMYQVHGDMSSGVTAIKGKKGYSLEAPGGKIVHKIESTVINKVIDGLMEDMPEVIEMTSTGAIATIPMPMRDGGSSAACGHSEGNHDESCGQSTPIIKVLNTIAGTGPIRGNKQRKIVSAMGGL